MRSARIAWVAFAACLLLAGAGCRRATPFRHLMKSRRSVHAPPLLAPLPASARIEKLELAKHSAAYVFIPEGARRPRPIVVALHGDESADAACTAWSTITNHDYFVLCPTLQTNSAGEGCNSVECVADELRDALIAMRQRFGRYVAPKEVMLVGRASGASRAVPIALQNPAVFSRVWLIDGGLREWSSAVSAAFAQRGGKFLGVACDGPRCDLDAPRVGTSARMAGLSTSFVKFASSGPSWAPEAVEAIRRSWQSAKPARFPWAASRKSEHTARPDG